MTQVSLWQSYRNQFETLIGTRQIESMLPAASVIKMTSDAFPGATPMVIEGEQRKFVIQNIRVRDRTGEALVVRFNQT